MAKMHDNEVDINYALVKRLLVEQFPQWSHLPTPFCRHRQRHLPFRENNDCPATPYSTDHIHKERHLLPKLAPHLPLAIPLPLAKGPYDEIFTDDERGLL